MFLLLVGVMLTGLLSGCQAAAPKTDPGGARIVATPAANIELVDVFMTDNPMAYGSGTPMPTQLRTNLPKIYLGLRFRNTGPDVDQFKVDYKLFYKGLELESAYDSQPTSWTEQASGATVLILPVRKADKTPFEPGQYSAQILINQQLIAELTWRVGGGED
ncbi:MAG: hypothetical protein ACKOC5_05230 [Chloroflexota bacterium]